MLVASVAVLLSDAVAAVGTAALDVTDLGPRVRRSEHADWRPPCRSTGWWPAGRSPDPDSST